MAVPVKVSDKLLALAKKEAETTHRSATAQIEHWATLGRAIEVMAAYRDLLALKRAGNALPMPVFVPRAVVHDLLAGLVSDPDRESVKARIRAAGGPLYTTDPRHQGLMAEVTPGGRRTSGRLVHRRFVPARRKSGRKRT
jgi:ParD-like antitoxin of type II ParDE toxin-antitoxin system